MFGELQSLFGRPFTIGFLLPAIALLFTVSFILNSFNLDFGLFKLLEGKDAFDLAIIAVLTWLGAVVLLALNGLIIQVISGYGRFNPMRVLRFRQIVKYRSLEKRRLALLDEKNLDDQESKEFDLFASVRWTLARDFPGKESLVLPTDFGNVKSATEAYSWVIYGIDATYGWSRLVAVIPSDYMKIIEDEKAQMDFWVNLWFTLWLCLFVYAAIAITKHSLPRLWLPPLIFCIGLACNRFAILSARRWGLLIMSAFDLFRSDLSKRLGLNKPREAEKERAMWQTASQVWIYRSDGSANRLSEYRDQTTNGGPPAVSDRA